jgi:Trypsin-like peptidase domain
MRCTCWALGIAAALLVALARPPRATAVVIVTGDGTGNTSAPADDPGWAAVGEAGGLSGVYLGNRWVLTANHVGAQAITFAGVTYQPIAGSKHQLMTDASTTADLALYQIDGDPPVPAVVLAATPPSVGLAVTLIGQGWNREPTLTTWSSSWTETPPGPTVYKGYKRAPGRAMRWGRDVVSEVGLLIPTGSNQTRAFHTTFDDGGAAVADEAHSVAGDSGGAVFEKRNGTWVLVGIMWAREIYGGQSIDTAVFGNMSDIVDVSFYRDQILELAAPAGIPLLPWPALAVLGGLLAAAARRALRRERA